MAKKKIRLTSFSNLKGAVGKPGDEISVDEDVAKRFIDGRGAVEVDTPSRSDVTKATKDESESRAKSKA